MEWYERWFGEEYLALYPHRDERDAAAAVALIEREVGGRTIERALDLACGAGRHARLLARRWWTVGLDLSPVLLKLARDKDPGAPLVRADMRVLPFRDGAFDLVTNMFTSFGYFAEDEEHVRVLEEVGRVTRRGATFVLDFFNASHVRSSLIPRDEREVGGVTVEQQRSLSPDGRFVIKQITAKPDGRTFVERVRLFEREELAAMLVGAGFRIRNVFGDYGGSTASDASPRATFFAERA